MDIQAEGFSEPVINYLLYGTSRNVCWLCLNEENSVDFLSVHDNVVISTKPYPAAVTFQEVLQTILGNEVDLSEVPHVICCECADQFIKTFMFIRKCKLQNVYWENTVNIANNLFKSEETEYETPVINTNNNVNKDGIIKKFTDPTIICPHCNKTINYNDYKEHITKMHQSVKYISCEKCCKTFVNHGSYSHHLEKCPKKDKLWKCNVCKALFPTGSLLTKHKQTKCKGAICKQCGKLLGNETQKSHKPFCLIKTVTKRKKAQFKCKSCPMEYTSRALLLVHVNEIHRWRNIPCPTCGNLFKTKSAVNDHMRVHSKDKQFTCDYCNKKFVTKRTLESHIRLHTGLKPYPCFVCNERFVATSRRLEHLRTVHWEPQFECDFCYRKFKFPDKLNSHKKRCQFIDMQSEIIQELNMS